MMSKRKTDLLIKLHQVFEDDANNIRFFELKRDILVCSADHLDKLEDALTEIEEAKKKSK